MSPVKEIASTEDATEQEGTIGFYFLTNIFLENSERQNAEEHAEHSLLLISPLNLREIVGSEPPRSFLSKHDCPRTAPKVS